MHWQRSPLHSPQVDRGQIPVRGTRVANQVAVAPPVRATILVHALGVCLMPLIWVVAEGMGSLRVVLGVHTQGRPGHLRDKRLVSCTVFTSRLYNTDRWFS